MRQRVIGLSLLLGLLVGWAQADHEVPVQCREQEKHLAYLQGQSGAPMIAETATPEEADALIRAWKDERAPLIKAAKDALRACGAQYGRRGGAQ